MNVSVIIPVFNEKKVLAGCVVSLLSQRYHDFEIIIVDDGSTDGSVEGLSNHSNEIPITILKQDHKGPAAARNLGAKQARGKILVFVDADMTFEKVFLKNLVAPIVSGKTIGTFSKDEHVSNWDNIWARCWNWNLNLPPKRRLPLDYPDKQKVFRAILASQYKKAGGFDKGGYTDDWSLSEKLNVLAENAKGARFYHKNPDTITEVFIQARWVSKRSYKFGIMGVVVALLRSSFPMTLIIGLSKSVLHADPRFLLFKLVYDFGTTLGILSYTATKKGSK